MNELETLEPVERSARLGLHLDEARDLGIPEGVDPLTYRAESGLDTYPDTDPDA